MRLARPGSAGLQVNLVRPEKVAQAFQPAVSQVFNLLAGRYETSARMRSLDQQAGKPAIQQVKNLRYLKLRYLNQAFTLMEIMLAMMVSAIVLAGIGGVLFSAMRLREHSVAALDRALPMHQAFAVLRRDLLGALPPGGASALAGNFRIEPQSAGLGGQSFRLHFYTTTGVTRDGVPWGDIQEVMYELRDASGLNGRELVRSVNRNVLTTATPQGDEQSLLSNVQSLEFAGYDGYDFRDNWDTSLNDTNLPTAVRVRILMAPEQKSDRSQQPFEMIVPLVTLSRTNQTTSTTSTTTQ